MKQKKKIFKQKDIKKFSFFLTHCSMIPIMRPNIIDVISSISSFGGCLPDLRIRLFFARNLCASRYDGMEMYSGIFGNQTASC